MGTGLTWKSQHNYTCNSVAHSHHNLPALLLLPFVHIWILLKLLIKTKGGGSPLLQCWRNINIERWWWSSCHLKPLTTNLAPLGEGQVLYLPIEVVESQPTREHCEQIMSVICILTNGGLSNAASDRIGTYPLLCIKTRKQTLTSQPWLKIGIA